MEKAIQTFCQRLSERQIPVPSIHIVLGSGFGQALDIIDSSQWKLRDEIRFAELPGLTAATVQDHPGIYRIYQNTRSSKSIAFQLGRLHGYEGHPASQVVRTVMIPRLAGVERFVLTNSAGGLDANMKPGDVMLIRDQVNLTGQNPLVGPNDSKVGPRFPDMGNLFDKKLNAALKICLEKRQLQTHEGVYLGLLGPSFETHAEVALFRAWGMKAVGMSTVWESIALKHSGAQLAGLSLIGNLGAGITDEPLDHEAILKAGRESAAAIVSGLCEFCEKDIK